MFACESWDPAKSWKSEPRKIWGGDAKNCALVRFRSLSFGTLNLAMGMRTGLPGMGTGANCNPEGVTLWGVFAKGFPLFSVLNHGLGQSNWIGFEVGMTTIRCNSRSRVWLLGCSYEKTSWSVRPIMQMQMQFNRVGVRELCELLLEGRGETCEFANHEIVRIATTGLLSSFVRSLVKYDESLRESMKWVKRRSWRTARCGKTNVNAAHLQ